MKVFIDNLFLYLENKDAILKDEMMYMAQVPVKNGLSICGPFIPAVLGTYLKWWETCEDSRGEDPDGKRWVIVKLSGSGLSGANNCLRVFEDGRQEIIWVKDFRYLVREFLQINKGFRNDHKDKDVYSLEQVQKFLKNFCNDM